MKPTIIVLSCEHASNELPAAYTHLFNGQQSVLSTHRAVDFGAREITDHLSQTLNCDYTKSTITRLLIDCNRSLTHAQCFSEFTRPLSTIAKQKLIDVYYQPYRQQTEAIIKKHIDLGHQVLHLSIHTFTPELNGVTRNAAIGLLYDSSRHAEREVARLWHELLLTERPAYRVRKNYPYNGKSDGFTSTLRKKYTQEQYLGLEVESNQALVQDSDAFKQLLHALSDSLNELRQLL